VRVKLRRQNQITTAFNRSGKAVSVSVALLAAGLLAGCHNGAPSANASPKAAASPKPTPTPLSLSAQIGNLNLTLLDEKGKPIAVVSARAGAVGPKTSPTSSPASGGIVGLAGQLAGSKAILYKNGVRTSQLIADTIEADREKRVVTGTGNVVVQSLALPEAPAIRADRMRWEFATGIITGSGNVLVTRKPDTRIPATTFKADTQLKKITLTGGTEPATGSF